MRYVLVALTLAATAVACGSSGSSTSTGDDDITDVANSPVKEQSIGNCWIYASTAWAESLHLSATGETLDLSESFVTYWDWYEEITQKTDNTEIQTGGFFDEATRLMTKYGVAKDADFIPNEGARSTAQSAALAKMNAALKVGGALGKVADRTPANVRKALDDAFGLAPEVRADLATTYGAAEAAPIGANHAARFIPATDLKVTSKKPGAPKEVSTLDKVATEWETAYVYGTEADSRGALRRLQKTMHDSLPALIVWNVDFASSANDGSFRKRPSSNLSKWDGAHMTVVEDYQAYHVPNIGLLPAGTLVTDPKVLDAALAENARMGFLRIKNSWGFRAGPAGSEDLKGYYDIYEDYMFGMHGLTSVIVPKAYDDVAPATDPDLCTSGTKLRSGTYCGKSITPDPNDKRVIACEGGATKSSITCDHECLPQPTGTPRPLCRHPRQSDPRPAEPVQNGRRASIWQILRREPRPAGRFEAVFVSEGRGRQLALTGHRMCERLLRATFGRPRPLQLTPAAPSPQSLLGDRREAGGGPEHRVF